MRRVVLLLVLCLPGCFSDSPPSGASGTSGASSFATDGETGGETSGALTDTTSTGLTGAHSTATGDSDPTSPTSGTQTSLGSSEATASESSGTSGAQELVPDLWYRFDGNVRDSAGMADGIPVGVMEYDQGLGDGALVMGPGYGHVRADAFGASFRDALDAMTIAFVARHDSYDMQSYLIALGDDGEGLDTNALLLLARAGRYELLTEVDAQGSDSSTDLGPLADVGIWHRLVFVFDQGRVKLFVDGSIHADEPYVPALTTSETLWVGAYYHGRPLTGLLDDLRVFLRPLSDDEATKLSAP